MTNLEILILEDDSIVQDILTEGLRADGHRTRCCSNAQEFYAMFQQDVFDLFLIDVNLPDGNGFDLARDLRRKTNSGIGSPRIIL